MSEMLHGVIEAFVDGEFVDPAELKTALSQDEGRDFLIDLLVLRGLVAGQTALRPAVSETPARPRSSPLRLVAAAAAIAGVSVLGGYLAGLRHTPNVAHPATVTGAPAPTPTHVIRLENGVDWNEKVGG